MYSQGQYIFHRLFYRYRGVLKFIQSSLRVVFLYRLYSPLFD